MWKRLYGILAWCLYAVASRRLGCVGWPVYSLHDIIRFLLSAHHHPLPVTSIPKLTTDDARTDRHAPAAHFPPLPQWARLDTARRMHPSPGSDKIGRMLFHERKGLRYLSNREMYKCDHADQRSAHRAETCGAAQSARTSDALWASPLGLFWDVDRRPLCAACIPWHCPHIRSSVPSWPSSPC